ncbi:MAG TPA: tetratricopeptide repeat protein [Xanthobacteraceae bacterium]|nr:tetratricopeptide repeat protein [Xanthobacteraceae bacterium]
MRLDAARRTSAMNPQGPRGDTQWTIRRRRRAPAPGCHEGEIRMTSIPRGTLAALAFASAVWLTATPAAANDVDTCENASGDEAIAACTRVINSGLFSGRKLAALLNMRCYELNAKRESDKAIADCSQAIRLHENYPSAFFNRGNAYRAKAQYDRSIEDYSQAIRLDPKDTDSIINRGNSYNNKGQYDRAIADYDQALRLKPDDADAFINRGVAYKSKGQHDRAIADYDQAIRLSPDDAAAFYNRGIAYDDKRQYDRAIADYDQAIRLNPRYAKAFYNRGLSRERNNDPQRALGDFRTFAELAPADPDGRRAVERVTKALRGR